MLRDLREGLNLTQEKTAELLKISYSAYRKYEYGETVPPLDVLMRMAKLFGLTLDEMKTDIPTQRAYEPDSIEAASARWEIGINQIRRWCQEGIITGAYKDQRWHIPEDTKMPMDNEYVKPGMSGICCIICGKVTTKKNPTSKEHIIPVYWGSHELVTNCVCKRCNNTLGSKVDKPLQKHPISQIIQAGEGFISEQDMIKGIFKRVVTGGDGRKYKFDGADLSVLPEVTTGDDPGHYHVDAGNVDEALKEARKKMSRDGWDEKAIEDAISHMTVGRKQQSQPEFKIDYHLDPVEFSNAMAKMAYEYASICLPEDYLEDPVAKVLRECLMEAMSGRRYERILQYVRPGISKESGIEAALAMMKQARYLHVIGLEDDDECGTLCFISLLGNPVLTFFVRVAEKKYNHAGKTFCFVPKDGKPMWL